MCFPPKKRLTKQTTINLSQLLHLHPALFLIAGDSILHDACHPVIQKNCIIVSLFDLLQGNVAGGLLFFIFTV